MRLIALLTIGLCLIGTGCAKAPREKAVTLVNAAAVDAQLLERVRAFAEQELRVRVCAVENRKLAGKPDFQAMEKAARRIKTDADVCLIVLTGFNNDSQHLAIYAGTGIAVINMQPLYTAEAETFARRIERQVMRAAAFSLGLPPTPDPFCVTRDYHALEDLDAMGRNFSPPWQGRFAEEAGKCGLFPVDVTAPAQ